MTNDLISRSKVEEVISALVHEEGITDDAAVLGCMVWNAIHTMEAVDAAPVVHSYWEPYGRNSNGTVGRWRCMNCKRTSLESGNFCPNCGAKMP